jgi:glycosyltransferase involved in cell wall biosynthesis
MKIITVVLPIYNGQRFLGETISSLSSQTFRNFTVLCVDDNSTDNSAEIVLTKSKSDPRFRYIRTPKNLGNVARVFNFIATEIETPYFVYSSQDDFFSANWLEEMVLKATLTGADATIPDLVFFNPTGEQRRSLIGVEGDRSIVLSGRKAFELSLNWTIPGNALWRTQLLAEHGFSDIGTYGDEYTVRRFFLGCQKVVFCAGTFYYRQDNPDAITKRVSPNLLDYPYSLFALWSLAETEGIDTKITCRLAYEAFYSLISAEAKIRTFANLRGAEDRLDSARAFLSNRKLVAGVSNYIGENLTGAKRVFFALALRNTLIYRVLVEAFVARNRIGAVRA